MVWILPNLICEILQEVAMPTPKKQTSSLSLFPSWGWFVGLGTFARQFQGLLGGGVGLSGKLSASLSLAKLSLSFSLSLFLSFSLSLFLSFSLSLFLSFSLSLSSLFLSFSLSLFLLSFSLSLFLSFSLSLFLSFSLSLFLSLSLSRCLPPSLPPSLSRH